METHALSLCWGSYSLVIDSIWLSCLHTCGWCLLSCMTSKGGSIGWHLNLWLMFSVLGWARGTALAEFSSCRRVCAERPWPHASSHTGKASWGRGHPLLSSSDVHEIRLGTWQCVIFAKPLMMCNTSLGGGLVWGWRPQVCSKIHIPWQWLNLSRLVQIRLCCNTKWIECYLCTQMLGFPGNVRIFVLFTFWQCLRHQQWLKLLPRDHANMQRVCTKKKSRAPQKRYERKEIFLLCWQAVLGT